MNIALISLQKKVLFIIVILITPFYSLSQNRTIVDSLKQTLNTVDTKQKVDVYVELSWQYLEYNVDTALLFAEQAVKFSGKVDNEKSKISAYNILGNVYLNTGKLDDASEAFEKALNISVEIADTSNIIRCKHNIANLLYEKGLFSEALQIQDEVINFNKEINDLQGLAKAYNSKANTLIGMGKMEAGASVLVESIKIKEKLGDKESAAVSASNLAVLFKMQKRYEESEKYAQIAVDISREFNNKSNLAYSLTSLAAAQYHLKQYDNAEKSSQEGIELFEEMQFTLGVVANLNQLGLVYREKGLFDKEKETYLQMLVLTDSSDYNSLIIAYNNLCGVYVSLKDANGALKYLKKSKTLIDKVEEKFDLLTDWNQYMSEVYYLKARYDSAYYYRLQFEQYKDSTLNKSTSATISELRVQLETEQLEREKESLEKDNEIKELKIVDEKNKQKRLLYIFLISLSFILILVLILYFRNKAKRLAEKQLQEKLRFKAILEAEEKERIRIAKDLHDGLGQLLSTAKLNVAGLEDEVKEEDKILVSNSMKLIDEAVTEVRNISHKMMPVALMEYGLASAVEALAVRVNESKLVILETRFEGMDSRLDQSSEIALYRVIQEVINNAIKHSQAKNILVSLSKKNERLQLIITDDGKGFDTAQIEKSTGIGWKNIYSRLSMINGNMDINSAPGKGTTININIAF